jgi:hypothetical protein
MDSQDAPWVLRRETRDGASAVHAERGESLEISLDARAAAAVGSGDGQGNGQARWFRHRASIPAEANLSG